jgi:hypothetical protein
LYSNGKLIVILNRPGNGEKNEDPPFPDATNTFDSALIIGQDQGNIRGWFSIRKMFQGWVSELNIWDRELSKDYIERMNDCKVFMKGNIVNWDKRNIQITNLKIETVKNLTDFCNKKEFYVSPQKVSLLQASTHCKSLGGQIAAPSNEEENDKLFNLIKDYPDCLDNENSFAWIGIEKKAKSGSWNQVEKPDSIVLFNKLGESNIKDLEYDQHHFCLQHLSV